MASANGPRGRAPVASRVLRYGAVSLITVAAGQVLLVALYVGARWPARAANAVAFLTASGLSLWLNRRWTWGRSGRSHLTRELAPFWIITLVGLALTTWAAATAETAARAVTASRLLQALVVGGAVCASFAVLWIAKFLVLDRVTTAGDG